MKKFVLEKMLHKKWMCICLLLGNILLIGIAVSNPMYYHAALNRTLQSDLEEVELKDVRNVGEVEVLGRLGKNKESGLTNYCFLDGDYEDPKQVCDALQTDYGIKAMEKCSYYSFPASSIGNMTLAEYSSTDKFAVSYLTDLKEHSNLLSGEWWGDSIEANQPVPCVVAESTMMKRELMVGQQITLDQVVDKDSKQPVTFEIVGVFSEKEGDSYWMEDTSQYNNEIFVSEKMFQHCLEQIRFEGGNDTIVRFHTLLDSSSFTDFNYKKLRDSSQQLKKQFSSDPAIRLHTGFDEALKTYSVNRGSIRMVMLILQVPVLLLLAIFIYMVSKQMLSMEENEIAMLKSRGGSRRQIVCVYLLQSAMISGFSTLMGIPVGMLFANLIGSASSFLQFVGRKTLHIMFSWDIVWYLLVANLFSIAVMVLPVISVSRMTIVEYKQEQKKEKKPLWKKLFLDIVLLGVSLYIYYNYTQQKEYLSAKIAAGGNVDCLLLLSSSLFILGCGLLALRIIPRIVWLVFTIGKRFWKPEWYASFLQIIRTSSKQQFISLFLIMTISLGIFDAVTASTINQNQEEELKFEKGADISLMEKWESNLPMVLRSHSNGVDIKLQYSEPDYEKYEALSNDVEAMTRVFRSWAKLDVIAETSKAIDVDAQVLGIEPKGFGECCWFRDDLEKKHWYHYLNLLAEQYNGLLVSQTLSEKYGIEVGDEVNISYEDALGRHIFEYSIGKVVGIINYWPTFANETMTLTEQETVEKQQNCYIIGNFDCIMSSIEVQPYSVYMKTKGDNVQPIYDWVKDNNIKLEAFSDTSNELLKEKNEPLYQCTNGLLTISFLVVILLCTTGFLIYWILSIRSRELLFGIYRAMGMSRREVKKMLINEQIFSTLFSILVGALVGYVTSLIFVPVMEIVYLPGSRYIPLRTVVKLADLLQLGGVIFLMVVICVVVLMKLVSRMNISQALKLGED
ncbi:MAG: ABC transporter permease [Lachnospiraceae bacterium]|nr:ABC transporter permease [Lachnospiraceae bacterium]